MSIPFLSQSLFPTPPLTTNLPHQPPENVQNTSTFLMPITDLSFRRIQTVHLIRFSHPKFLSTRNTTAALKGPMAEEVNSNKTTVIDSNINVNKAESEKNEEKSKVIIPPPPEKPLPDDCCGSGCVRCVWDMYYEELEEYNKLYKNNSDAKTS